MKLPVHLENRDSAGEKLLSPSASRNSEFIGPVLANIFPDQANVLEIASGTGQHGDLMTRLRKDLRWQLSDIDPVSLASQRVYARENELGLLAPLILDVTVPQWWTPLGPIDAIFCANMVHIARWEAALGLAEGAGHVLKSGEKLCLYGPFLDGENSAVSNIEFDQSLKSRNPSWGVRNLQAVKHIFADAGLNTRQVLDMPRDNKMIVFERR